MVVDILALLMVSVKLREHFAHIVNNQLRQLSIMVLYDEAEELAVAIVDDVADLLLEGERRELLPLEPRAALLDL